MTKPYRKELMPSVPNVKRHADAHAARRLHGDQIKMLKKSKICHFLPCGYGHCDINVLLSYYTFEGVIPVKRNSIRAFCLSIAVMLLVAAALPAFASDKGHAYVVNIANKHDRLNVHGTPSIDDVIDHIDDGTVVLYHYSDKGWWYVEWWKDNNVFGEGYVDPAFLSAIHTDVAAKYTGVDNLYLHTKPDIPMGQCSAYHTGDVLRAGQAATVVDQDGNWALISFNGKTGWVASKYLIRMD